MIDLSSNEAASLVKLAARGAGYPWGVAEESAYASRWYSTQEIDGLSLFAALFHWSDDYATEDLSIRREGDKWSGQSGQLCPLLAGCAVTDFADLLDSGRTLVLEQVVCAAVLLPFLVQVSSQLQKSVEVRWEVEWLVCNAAKPEVVTSTEQARVEFSSHYAPITLSISCSESTTEHGKTWSLKSSPRVSSDVSVVQLLRQFAHRTYAPATEQSRLSGAGAGTSDND
ncbi:MAG: DUF3726 domain-containing protein [Granulosicoccus sp.]